MNDSEVGWMKQRRYEYYFEHWHRVLLQKLRYKHPCVANADNYSLLTLKSFHEQQIFFHVDFIKPGKSTYVVEHKE